MRVFLASCCWWGKDSKKKIIAEDLLSLKAQLSKHIPSNELRSISYWDKDVDEYVDLDDETLFEDQDGAAGVITIRVNTKSRKFVISCLAASTGRPANLSQVGELE